MTSRISILLADDHALVRRTLRASLETYADLTVTADVGSAEEAVAHAQHKGVDVALLDVDMPGLSCFEAARLIRRRCPETRVVFLSAFCNDRYIKQALAVGASGYITKNEPPETLVQAIHDVACGAAYYSPEVRSRIVIDEQGARLEQDQRPRSATLSEREVQVLQYVARGMSKKEIAGVMHLSERTVNCHCASLMGKLDIHDRVALTRYAIREGLVEP
ncbi:MAG: response regulator transcription factor [Phycisphaerae bacterium]|jgi:DNA-binding NarL/FixJ family response regulator